MTDERIKAAKNLAAVKAFEAYVETLKDALGEEGLVEVLGGTGHIHTGVLFVGDKSVAVVCEWNFSTDARVIEKMIEARTKSAAPS